MRPPILTVAGFIILLADGIQFAPAFSEQDLLRWNSHLHQRIAGCQSAQIGQVDVINDVASRISLASDGEDHIGMRFQPFRILLKRRLILGLQLRPVKVEINILDVLNKLLLLGWRHRDPEAETGNWRMAVSTNAVRGFFRFSL